ncbi:cupin domain-containing protein [Streptomyces sp. NPDC002790]|uniref:cupin domain-containing protein n=1 Tax=Streptomyces sp. NPDC002790 TaxID=3154431 RepID=UPI00331D6E94
MKNPGAMSAPRTTPLETWQPEGVTLRSGTPAGRGFTLFEDHRDGARATGFFECDPAVTEYLLEYNEFIYVIEGQARVELDDGSAVELGPGDCAFLPKGHRSTWTFRSTFKEFWVLCD